MAAIVGFVLGESYTEPAIAELAVSKEEDLVYIRQAGAAGFDGIQELGGPSEQLEPSARRRGVDARGAPDSHPEVQLKDHTIGPK